MVTALAGLVALGGVGTAQAAEPGPQHAVTCKWDNSVNAPWSVDAEEVRGFVRVLCSDSLDDANTRAQVQVLDGAQWFSRGEGVTSYSTAKTIHVNDSTTKQAGTCLYRTVGTHYGQHGNIWALPTFYSNTRYLAG
ncbi:hypothetical protein ACIPW5_07000 [Streptomyces sp. NPDC090077]|uniref:hypothetical protein n=1 Tax=Streptomyces sp. NPDC090077 TaxID=3365938 RepID=UPI0038011449